MAVPQYRDEVLITLTSQDPPSSFSFPDRRFFLTKEKPVKDIGRTSKRNSSFEAAKNNAWFDSPVMSRDHASLKFDLDKQKVYIKDVGSLHGTFKNNQPLGRNILCPLASGDTIQFGIPIERGSEKYPACTMEARIMFGSINPEDRPKVFRVPDDSDVEESGSDDDHSIRISSEILRGAKVRPAVLPSLSPQRSTIDLTGNDQYPISNVRADNYATNTLPAVSPDAKHPHEVTYVDLSSPSPEDTTEYNGFSPVSPTPCWGSGYEEVVEEESDINLSESTDMDTASSPEANSASQSSSPASISSDVHNDFGTRTVMDIEGDEFEDQDEFDNEDSVSESFEESTGQENLQIPEQFAPPQPISHFTHDTAAGMIPNTYETNTLEVLSAECVNQDAPGNGNSISPLVTYTFKPHLPPIEQPRMEPPWAQPNYVQALRLPSISETVPPYPLPQSPDSKAVAEVMGARTGKYEFFAARAENKMNALPSGVAPPDNSISIGVTQFPEQNVPPTQTMPQDSNAEMATLEEPASVPAEVTQLQANTPKRLAPSEWTASGEQFLNTPPKESQQLDQVETHVLDETSAYQFELSKKAASDSQCDQNPAESQVEPTKRTHMDICDIVEASNEANEQSTPSRPPKRKASEICQLMPEEEPSKEDLPMINERKRRSYQVQQAFRRRLTKKKQRALCAPVADIPVPPASDSLSQPPAKRLRRVAEVLSYAALGGVAVMSALIATAPTL